MTHPLFILRIAIWHAVYFCVNFSYGLWFMFRHPISFAKFAKEYRRFEIKIDAEDQIVDSGFYNLSRRDRRAMKKRVKKFMEIRP